MIEWYWKGEHSRGIRNTKRQQGGSIHTYLSLPKVGGKVQQNRGRGSLKRLFWKGRHSRGIKGMKRQQREHSHTYLRQIKSLRLRGRLRGSRKWTGGGGEGETRNFQMPGNPNGFSDRSAFSHPGFEPVR